MEVSHGDYPRVIHCEYLALAFFDLKQHKDAAARSRAEELRQIEVVNAKAG